MEPDDRVNRVGLHPRILLATDLDRTLLPNGDAPESPGARPAFARVAARPDVVLAYVTGRHRALVEAAITEFRLPRPDFVIGDVGTTIWHVRDGEWLAWPDWPARIGTDWAGRDARAVRALLAPLSELTPQEVARQGTHKVSYHAAALADPAPLLARARALLEGAGLRVNLVWSLDEAAGLGLLDVLPAAAGKLAALQALRQHLRVAPTDTLFAGDSGNDLEVLGGPLPSVLVANAADDVRARAVAIAGQSGHADLLYLARGGWRGMNGNYAAGILEGLEHFHPVTRAW